MSYFQIGGIVIVLGIPAGLIAIDRTAKAIRRAINRHRRDWIRRHRLPEPRWDSRNTIDKWWRLIR